MAESELMYSKESPSDQYHIMEKLYVELEQEREASATAASEALSMILRLQGEKAAEKLEACQYKRMAEEKIHHAEESLEILEELLYQKEKEVASLKFQVQTYGDRLLKPVTFSSTSSGMSALKIPLLRNADAFRNNMSSHGTVRSISLPVMESKNICSDVDSIDEKVLSLETSQPIEEYSNKIVKNMDNEESAGAYCIMWPPLSEKSPISNCNVHCDKIAKEHKHVKLTSDKRRVKEHIKSDHILEHLKLQMSMPMASMSSEKECISCSWYSSASGNTFYDSTVEVTESKVGIEDVSSSCLESEDSVSFRDFDSYHHSYSESALPGNIEYSLSVHDKFEVPQDDYHDKPQNKLSTDYIPEKKEAFSTLYSTTKDDRDHYCKDDGWLIKELQDGQCGTLFHASRKGVGMDYNWASNNSKIGAFFHQGAEELCMADVKRFEKRLQVLEDDIRLMKQQDSDRKEQLKLLKEISERLRLMHSQLQKPPAKKFCHQDDISLISIMEAMLSCSI